MRIPRHPQDPHGARQGKRNDQRDSSSPVSPGPLRPGSRGAQCGRPRRAGLPAARSGRPLPAQRPQPTARPGQGALVHRPRHAPRRPAAQRTRRVVPQPVDPHTGAGGPSVRPRGLHHRPGRNTRQHPRDPARRQDTGPVRGGPSPLGLSVAGDGRTVRLRGSADHGHDRSSQGGPGHRRTAPVRDRVRPALPHLPPGDRGGTAARQPAESTCRARR